MEHVLLSFQQVRLRIALAVCSFLADLLYVVFTVVWPYRQAVIEENLGKAGWQRPDSIKALRRAYYRHLSDVVLESFLFHLSGKKTSQHLVTYRNADLLQQYYKQGRDVVLLIAHYGNWEYLATLPLASDYPVLSAYTPLNNQIMERWLRVKRERFGAHLVPKNSFYRAVLSQVGTVPRLYAIIADQRPSGQPGQVVSFMGRPTPVQAGAERIAQHTNSVVLYVEVEKVGRHRYAYQFTQMPPPSANGEGPSVMASFFSNLEKSIQRSPEWWLWSHRRWKE